MVKFNHGWLLKHRHLHLPVTYGLIRLAVVSQDWNWAFLMDMRIFLFFGFCGVLRQHLPFALPATCLVYWAHLIGRAVREGPCPFAVFEELESHTYWTTHFSFWMNWFPTALLLLNLDTCLRQPTAIYLMGRLKQIFGRLLIFFVAAMLLMSFCIGTVLMLRQDWQKLGFSKCPMIDGGNSPSIPYVLAGLPFHITVFISLHLASAPALGKDDHDHLVPLQVPLAFLCEAFRCLDWDFLLKNWPTLKLNFENIPPFFLTKDQVENFVQKISDPGFHQVSGASLEPSLISYDRNPFFQHVSTCDAPSFVGSSNKKSLRESTSILTNFCIY